MGLVIPILNVERVGGIFIVGAIVEAFIDDDLDLVEDVRREVANVVGDDKSINSVETLLSVEIVRSARDIKIGRMGLTGLIQ